MCMYIYTYIGREREGLVKLKQVGNGPLDGSRNEYRTERMCREGYNSNFILTEIAKVKIR